MSDFILEDLDESQFVADEPKSKAPRRGVWYKIYPKLSSFIFIYENSGKCSSEAPPYNVIYRKGGDLDIEGIKGEWGMDQHWKVLGYTEQPPFGTSYESVAVMFEDQVTFEKRWWHYPI